MGGCLRVFTAVGWMGWELEAACVLSPHPGSSGCTEEAHAKKGLLHTQRDRDQVCPWGMGAPPVMKK